MTIAEAIRAFNHGAPGVRVEFSIDQDGVLTIDNWEGLGPIPSVAQVETWVQESATEMTNVNTIESTLSNQLMAGFADINTHLAILNGSPTAAQQKAALIFVFQAIKKLARLQLRILDSTD